MSFWKKLITSESSVSVRSDTDQRSIASRPQGHSVMQFSLPRLQGGLSDLVSSHRAGESFNHAVVATTTQESAISILERLKKAVNRPKKSDIMFSSIPIESLTGNHHEIKLAHLESKKLQAYVRIKEVQANFTPLTSVYDRFTPAIFELHDARHSSNTLRRSHTINSNLSDTFRFELDYCIPRERLDCFTIVVRCETTGLNYGEIWGTVQFKIALETASVPYQTDMNSTMAILQLPGTFLENSQVDPRFLNMTMDGDTRKEMIAMKQRGDIVSTDKPVLAASIPTGYAGTSYGLTTQQNTAQSPITMSPMTSSWVNNQSSTALISTSGAFSNLKNSDGTMIKNKIKKSVQIEEPILEYIGEPIASSSQQISNVIPGINRFDDLSSIGEESPSVYNEINSPTGIPAQDKIMYDDV